MKKILFLVIALIVFASCSKKEDPKPECKKPGLTQAQIDSLFRTKLISGKR